MVACFDDFGREVVRSGVKAFARSVRRTDLLAVIMLAAASCAIAASALASGEIPPTQLTAPVFTVLSAQNGAAVVGFTEGETGSKVYYTLDGSAPTIQSKQFFAPFLVASNETVQAIAVLPGRPNSAIASRTFAPNVGPGTLVWSDEFANATGGNAQPNPTNWTYDAGASGYGNAELEDYCAWGSKASPCTPDSLNAYVGTDGYLHIVARQPAPGVYTSARLKTQGLFSFQYGRLEFRAMVPEAKGLWPAGWLLGNTVGSQGWPACGEQDVLERVNAATEPDSNQGSVHGPGFIGTSLGTPYYFTKGVTAATWHTYGMIWKPGSVSYYVDDPSRPYAVFTEASLTGLAGASWPFDGPADFLVLNLAVGGQWPGNPTPSTSFPAQMLVDYVRIYTN